MTERQEKLYWRLWRDACLANHWRTEKGRLCLDAERLSDLGQAVMACADARARANHRARTLEDLRHGVHWVALGMDKSSKQLSKTSDVDRVFVVLKLLIDPENLDAVMAWQKISNLKSQISNSAEDPGERLRLVFSLRSMAPAAYVAAIARDKFDLVSWEDLPMASLRQLLMTVANRRRGKEQTTEHTEHTEKAEETVECPF